MNSLHSVFQFFGFKGMLNVFQLAITFATLAGVFYYGLPKLTRIRASVIGLIWVLLATMEYWIAGPFSYVFGATDILMSLPFYSFLNQWHDSGLYSHAFNGGMDIASTMANAGQFISFEKFLVGIAPMWIANMVQKILAVGLGFWGIYLLSRRVAGTGRDIALGLAALYPFTQNLMIHHSWLHGMGYAIIPMAAYLCVFRFGKRYYFTGAIFISAFHAISSAQPLSGMAFFPVMILAALLADTHRKTRMAVATFVPGIFVFANWGESLYAKALMGPFTLRGTNYSWAAANLNDLLSNFLYDLTHEWEISFVAVLGLVICLVTRNRKFIVATFSVVLALWAGVALNQLPWQDIGVASLSGVNFRYTSYSMPTIGMLVMAIASAGLDRHIRVGGTMVLGSIPAAGIKRFLIAAIIALAVGKFAWYKAVNISVWLSEGGLPVLTENMKRLENRSWAPEEPFRVVTIPYRLSPNMAPAVGLDALDATSQLILRSMAVYWRDAVIRGTIVSVDGGFMIIESNEFDPKCCPSYDISKYINLDFLRIANVGYILSTLPLHGEGIVKVSGPPEDRAPPRNTLPFKARILAYVDAIIDPPPVYVYAIGKPLPRVYVARGLVFAKRDLSDESYLKLIKQHAPTLSAVVKNTSDLPTFVVSDKLEITDYRLVPDGFDISLSGAVAGSVIINAPYIPYWKAYANGIPTDIGSANMVHMIISVPAGTNSLKLRYERPLLRHKAKKMLFN